MLYTKQVRIINMYCTMFYFHKFHFPIVINSIVFWNRNITVSLLNVHGLSLRQHILRTALAYIHLFPTKSVRTSLRSRIPGALQHRIKVCCHSNQRCGKKRVRAAQGNPSCFCSTPTVPPFSFQSRLCRTRFTPRAPNLAKWKNKHPSIPQGRAFSIPAKKLVANTRI